MKWLVKWGVKKWLLNITNTALSEYDESVARARRVVSKYRNRVQAFLTYLESLDAKLADNRITDDEADAICDEAVTLAGLLTEK